MWSTVAKENSRSRKFKANNKQCQGKKSIKNKMTLQVFNRLIKPKPVIEEKPVKEESFRRPVKIKIK